MLTKARAAQFNPMRCGFVGGEDVWVSNVLNVGVRPVELILAARARFESLGGQVVMPWPLPRFNGFLTLGDRVHVLLGAAG